MIPNIYNIHISLKPLSSFLHFGPLSSSINKGLLPLSSNHVGNNHYISGIYNPHTLDHITRKFSQKGTKTSLNNKVTDVLTPMNQHSCNGNNIDSVLNQNTGIQNAKNLGKKAITFLLALGVTLAASGCSDSNGDPYQNEALKIKGYYPFNHTSCGKYLDIVSEDIVLGDILSENPYQCRCGPCKYNGIELSKLIKIEESSCGLCEFFSGKPEPVGIYTISFNQTKIFDFIDNNYEIPEKDIFTISIDTDSFMLINYKPYLNKMVYVPSVNNGLPNRRLILFKRSDSKKLKEIVINYKYSSRPLGAT